MDSDFNLVKQMNSAVKSAFFQLRFLSHVMTDPLNVGVSFPLSHISPGLVSLHWLPVCFKTDFKILIFAYKSLNSPASV